jgi:hypothetical protein
MKTVHRLSGGKKIARRADGWNTGDRGIVEEAIPSAVADELGGGHGPCERIKPGLERAMLGAESRRSGAAAEHLRLSAHGLVFVPPQSSVTR